jgi:hypothetical protein
VFAPQGTLDRPELGSLNPTPRISREPTPENWEEEEEEEEEEGKGEVVEETPAVEAAEPVADDPVVAAE